MKRHLLTAAIFGLLVVCAGLASNGVTYADDPPIAPAWIESLGNQHWDKAGNESEVYPDTTLPETGVDVYVSPSASSTVVSNTVTVELRGEGIENLYGVQVKVYFNPIILQVVDAYDFVPGVQIEEGNFPTPDVVQRNQADNLSGCIEYVASLQGNKPGVSGGGVLARIVFLATRPGTTAIDITEAILSDPQSRPIAIHTLTDASVTVSPAPLVGVQGRVVLERRSDNTGAQVCLDARCVTTPADGGYRIWDITAGSYWLTVNRPSYLASKRAVTVAPGLLTLPDVTLLGGDIDQDGRIYVRDMVAVGISWATHPGDPTWDQRADITADDAINVLDMVAVQYNWDARAPGPWLTAFLLPQSLPPAARPLPDTRVFIAPANAILSAPGQAVELAVRVEEVADLYGLGFSITFDPAVLRVRDADPRPSAPGVQIRPGDFLDPFNQFVVVNRADNSLGRIEFAATQTQPAQARNGAGVLATITFEAVAQGSSAVTFAEVELVNDARPDPQIIPANLTSGQVTIGKTRVLYLPLLVKG